MSPRSLAHGAARFGIVGSALVAVLLATSSARARDHRHEDDDTEVAHEGVYIRLSLGPGAAFGTLRHANGSGSATAHGRGFGLQLAGGSTVSEGIVGGGMLSLLAAPAEDVGTLNFSVIGPFVDVYPDDLEGLHFGVMAGYATASMGQNTGGAKGIGGVGWGGYDFWIGDTWSFGVQAQVHAGTLHGNGETFGPLSDPLTFGSASLVLGGSLQLSLLYQ